MTRIGIISDLHGNLHATLAVLARLNEMGVNDIVCLGDVVGYGPAPDKCLELVETNCSVCIRGNHEEAVLDPTRVAGFNSMARHALRWTRNILGQRHTKMITAMPLVEYIDESVMCIHDCPTPASNSYVHDSVMATRAFRGFDTQICLIGHTHVPAMFEVASLNPEDELAPADIASFTPVDGVEIILEEDCRYVLNPGSVGQPRDNDPRASFAVLDLDRRRYVVHREEYDIAAARNASEHAGLPDLLGERLAMGA